MKSQHFPENHRPYPFTRKYPFGNTLCSIFVLSATALPCAQVYSQTEKPEYAELEEVVTMGTRRQGRSAADLPVPVDTLTSDAMEKTGQTEVGRMLQSLAPSFNFSSSTISDGTDALRPATLRGLGPDQTLVLINGKRRHTGALIHVNTSVGRGTAGVDLNAIPSSAIKRIEVLRDGAAAQYGSDAIAGVINIVLKDSDEAGTIATKYGEYSEGDGENTLVSINKGFSIGGSGFVNGTLEYRDRGATNRAGLTGFCQYLAGCDDTDGDGIPNATDPREATFDRQNFRIGDSDAEQLTFIGNAGVEVGTGEAYGFITYSDRENESGGFYRRANQSGLNPTLSDSEAFYPNGFLPLISTEIDDFSVGAGYRNEFDGGLSMDVSLVTGSNDFAFTINNSVNASFVQNEIDELGGADSTGLRSTAPRTADAGELSMGLTTFNVDLVKPYNQATFALGFEYRIDEYTIEAGEEYSYLDFDGPGGGAAGIQVFPGFQPGNEVDEDRDVISVYFDTEYEFSDSFLVNGSLRYDDYSDFGDTINVKGALRYDITDTVVLRGAVSTGFRAPSMQQQFFNNVSTQFDSSGNPLNVGTFRNDSALAKAVGIPELKEEESTNISVGLAFEPLPGLDVTLDYYNIEIEDRIVISGRLSEGLGNASLDAALQAQQVSGAQFFLNAADTKTEGVDIVATYDFELSRGILNLSLAANFTNTKITDVFAPDSLQGVPLTSVFGEQDRSIIEEWQPEERQTLTALYQDENWSASVSLNRYGEYTVLDGDRQTFGAEILTDARLSYDFNNGFSVNLGGNNIFNVTPDKNRVGQSRSGVIEDANGNIIVDSAGVFNFSRRAAPFGFNGAFFYAGVNYNF